VTFLAEKRVRPPGMVMYNRDFGYQEAKNMRLLWETSCMSKEHSTRCPNHGLWIGDCRLFQSMATESIYTTNCWQRTVLEVEEALWTWHASLEGYFDWMWRAWMWKLQQRDIEWGDNCFGGAPGTVVCFREALVKLQAQLIVCKEFWAWCRLGRAAGKI